MFTPWTITTNVGWARPITTQAGTKSSKVWRFVACCTELFCAIIRNKLCLWQRQRLFQWTCANSSLGHKKHYRIDATTSTVKRKTGESTSVGPCPCGCKDFHTQTFDCVFHQCNMQSAWYCTERRTTSATTRPGTCSHRRTDHRGSNAHTRKTYCVDCGTYIDSVPRENYYALEATRSASSIRNDELTNRVLKETTKTKRQLDLATRMMLEQASRLSDGDDERAAMVQIFLDCDRVTETHACSVRLVPRETHAFWR